MSLSSLLVGNSPQGDCQVKNDSENLEPRMTSPTEHKIVRHASLATLLGAVCLLPRLLVTAAGKTFSVAWARQEGWPSVSAPEVRRQNQEGTWDWLCVSWWRLPPGGGSRSSYDQSSREPIRGSNWRIGYVVAMDFSSLSSVGCANHLPSGLRPSGGHRSDSVRIWGRTLRKGLV